MCSGICPVVTPKVPRERPQPEQNASLIGLNFPVLPPPPWTSVPPVKTVVFIPHIIIGSLVAPTMALHSFATPFEPKAAVGGSSGIRWGGWKDPRQKGKARLNGVTRSENWKKSTLKQKMNGFAPFPRKNSAGIGTMRCSEGATWTWRVLLGKVFKYLASLATWWMNV